MGMLYGAQIQTMMPKLHSTNFEGMELIRPLYLIREADIIHWRDYNNLAFIQCESSHFLISFKEIMLNTVLLIRNNCIKINIFNTSVTAITLYMTRRLKDMYVMLIWTRTITQDF